MFDIAAIEVNVVLLSGIYKLSYNNPLMTLPSDSNETLKFPYPIAYIVPLS